MNLLVISDLHISNGDRFDTFRWTDKDFIEMLEDIIRKEKIEKVILNGDIYELYKYKMNDIIENNHVLFDYLNNEKFVYIRGNHDIFNTFGLDNYLIRNKKGQTIYIEHGHNADFLNGTSIGRLFSKFGYDLLKLIIKYEWVLKVYMRIVNSIDEVDRIPKKYNTLRYLKYALRLLKNYDVVILGHTHKIETHKTYFLNNKKRYLNCGSCSLGRFQAVVIDTETLKYDTIKIGRKDIEKKNNKKKKKEKHHKVIKLSA